MIIERNTINLDFVEMFNEGMDVPNDPLLSGSVGQYSLTSEGVEIQDAIKIDTSTIYDEIEGTYIIYGYYDKINVSGSGFVVGVNGTDVVLNNVVLGETSSSIKVAATYNSGMMYMVCNNGALMSCSYSQGTQDEIWLDEGCGKYQYLPYSVDTTTLRYFTSDEPTVAGTYVVPGVYDDTGVVNSINVLSQSYLESSSSFDERIAAITGSVINNYTNVTNSFYTSSVTNSYTSVTNSFYTSSVTNSYTSVTNSYTSITESLYDDSAIVNSVSVLSSSYMMSSASFDSRIKAVSGSASISSSYAETASYALNVPSQSWNSISNKPALFSSSLQVTFPTQSVQESCSYATTASYAETASYSLKLDGIISTYSSSYSSSYASASTSWYSSKSLADFSISGSSNTSMYTPQLRMDAIPISSSFTAIVYFTTQLSKTFISSSWQIVRDNIPRTTSWSFDGDNVTGFGSGAGPLSINGYSPFIKVGGPNGTTAITASFTNYTASLYITSGSIVNSSFTSSFTYTTSSYALSTSYASTASYATTASYAINVPSQSWNSITGKPTLFSSSLQVTFPSSSISSSYATTASYALKSVDSPLIFSDNYPYVITTTVPSGNNTVVKMYTVNADLKHPHSVEVCSHFRGKSGLLMDCQCNIYSGSTNITSVSTGVDGGTIFDSFPILNKGYYTFYVSYIVSNNTTSSMSVKTADHKYVLRLDPYVGATDFFGDSNWDLN